uniref:DM10 domain-containing protein n=1 Tax=Phaeomonas parva TaxID=124430 RepID=A0A7S1XS94_9STRA
MLALLLALLLRAASLVHAASRLPLARSLGDGWPRGLVSWEASWGYAIPAATGLIVHDAEASVGSPSRVALGPGAMMLQSASTDSLPPPSRSLPSRPMTSSWATLLGGDGSQRLLPNLPGVRRTPQRPSTKSQALRTVNGYNVIVDSIPRSRRAPTGDAPQVWENNDGGTVGGASTLSDYFRTAPGLNLTSPEAVDAELNLRTLSRFSHCRDAAGYGDLGGRYSIRAQTADRSSRQRHLPFSPGASSIPRFISQDRKVLCFQAYCIEDIEESNLETQRVRRFDIYYYLTDESIEVYETRQKNSGMPQGCFIRRHRIPKMDQGNAAAEDDGGGFFIQSVSGAGASASGPATGLAPPLQPRSIFGEGATGDNESAASSLDRPKRYFGLADLYVGAELPIYGKTFTIVDANESTRRYLLEAGLDVGAQPRALPYPDDEARMRAGAKKSPGMTPSPMRTFMEAQLGKPQKTADLQSFLENDRKVLRFFCIWDDRHKLYGDLQRFTLHYHLSDDTIEVLQMHHANDGRDRFPKFMRRCKVPKPGDGLGPAANTLGVGGSAGEREPYHWTDLSVGANVNLYGRSLKIVDADHFTRAHYMRYGKVLHVAEVVENPDDAANKVVVERYIPPYNGYGSEEDSLQTCSGSIRPTPPKRDLQKIKEKGGIILRFSARLASDLPEDRNREFIIMYYAEDNSVAVREPPVRNSGIMGGAYLRRMCSPIGEGPFDATNFYIGAKVKIYTHHFKITNADEYTLRYMETNSKKGFLFSDHDRVVEKAQDKVGLVRRALLEVANPKLSSTELREITRRVGLKFEDQEIITLMRVVDKRNTGRASVTKLIKILESKTMEQQLNAS